ncbi:MAG: thioredoxin domain-containing protein [Dehalococcoidia bacterium]
MYGFRFSPRPNRAHEIAWRPWGEAAFQEAQREDKPILLSISAVWCHWCHIMDETSYSDPDAIRLINADFIPVRVDNDQRPEVNQRYNMGGWPTTAFLTPHGDLIAGGTYIPPHQFKEALGQVADLYRQQKAAVYRSAEEMKNRRLQRVRRVVSGTQLSAQIVDLVTRAVTALYDPFFGGFGTQPKFPMPDAQHLLLDLYAQFRDPIFLRMVVKTLDGMLQGAVFDKVEGGFFRYSTQRDWSEPHYEKMAEDQGALMRLLLRTWLYTGATAYRDAAQAVVAYVNRRLYTPEMGAFWGSQDADETYYSQDKQGREKLLPPLVDRTVYTNWNGQLAVAYMEASDLMGQPHLRQQAIRSLGFLWEHLCQQPGNVLFHCWAEGKPFVEGTLPDYAWVALAMAEAYRRTGAQVWLERSQALAQAMLERFWDAQSGGFWDVGPGVAPLGYLQFKEKAINDNTVAAQALRLLANLTGQADYATRAYDTLSAFAGSVQDYGEHAAPYAREVLRQLFPPVEVSIVGPGDALETRALLEAAFSIPYPCIDPILVDGGDAEALASRGFTKGEKPQAYVCLQGACLPPIDDPARLAEAIGQFLAIRGETQ